MSRRPATFSQADVARAIRAAKQAGAESVEVRPDSTIVVVLKSAPVVPDDPFAQWEETPAVNARESSQPRVKKSLKCLIPIGPAMNHVEACAEMLCGHKAGGPSC
jgi:hypothetical protein